MRIERHGAPARVEVVVGVTGVDVEVGAAEPDRGRPQKHLTGSGLRPRDLPHGEPPDVVEDRGAHRTPLYQPPPACGAAGAPSAGEQQPQALGAARNRA